MELLKIDISKGWTPDLLHEDIYRIGGLKVCSNLLPVDGYYLPFRNKSIFNSSQVNGIPLAGFSTIANEIRYNFLGTTTNLYRFTKKTLSDVTRASGNYNGSFWNFAPYGDWVIATNFIDDIQVLKGLSASNFQALGGSPPKAKYCLMNNGHLIIANLMESGYLMPKKIKWSARENIENWTPSLLTGAGEKDLSELHGDITGLGAIGNEFIITTSTSVSIGYYVGGAYTFAFKLNAYVNIGCHYPATFISIGNAVLFWGKEDIYMVDAQGVKNIGGHVRKTVLSNINPNMAHKITSFYDKRYGLIIWLYPTFSGFASPDKMLVYSIKENKFSQVNISGECIFIGHGVDEVFINDINEVINTVQYFINKINITEDSESGVFIDDINERIDTVQYYMGTNEFLPTDETMLIGDTDGYIKGFLGSLLDAEVETGEGVNEPNVLTIKKAYLPIEGHQSSGTVTTKHRYSIRDPQIQGVTSQIRSDNSVDLRTTNKRIALNVRVSNFTRIGNSIDVEIVKSGGR